MEDHAKKMISDTDPIADLVMSMLAVNQWRLEQSGEIYDGLLKEGLFDSSTIVKMNHGELKSALIRAGYKKSEYVVDLICDRLFDMAHKLSREEAKFKDMLSSKDTEAIKTFLMTIKGVGSKVYENFCYLHGNLV